MLKPLWKQTLAATSPQLTTTVNYSNPPDPKPQNRQPPPKDWLIADIFKHTLGFLSTKACLDIRSINRRYKQLTEEHINTKETGISINFNTNFQRLLNNSPLKNYHHELIDKLTHISLTPLENLLNTFHKLTLEHIYYSTQPTEDLTPKDIQQLCKLIANASNYGPKRFTLKLSKNPLTKVYLKEFPETATIKRLDLGDTGIKNEDLAYIAKKFLNLEELSLLHAPITSLKYLEDLPELKVLNLYGTKIGNEDLEYISKHCPKLEKLILSNPPITSLEFLGNLPELKVLDLSYTKIGNEDLKYISKHCPKLEKLILSNTPITSLKHLGNLPELKVLDLYGTKIGNENLEYIAKHCPKLGKLDLRCTPITSLEFLGNLPELKVLKLSSTLRRDDQVLAHLTPERFPKLVL